MGYLRFWRRINLFSGLSLNIGKKGISFSLGPKGLKYTSGKNGNRVTVGLPQTGISYTHKIKDSSSKSTTSFSNTSEVNNGISDLEKLKKIIDAQKEKQ